MMDRKTQNSLTSHATLTLLAWAAMLLASSLVPILWRELAAGEPYWWSWVQSTVLLAFFALTFIRANLKPLRGFILILLVIFFLGYGNPPLSWGLIPLVRSSPLWVNWTSQAPWALSNIALHLFRLTPALVILAFLLLMGLRRKDLFLVKGKINAPVEPSRLLGMKKPEPWTRIGSIFAIVFTVVTFAFLMLSWRPSLDAFVKVLPLIPVSLFIAVVNAFNEEFTFRAAPLSKLVPVIGKQQALMITAVYFGLGHFYGVPNNVPGVLMSAFLGWFLGKSLLETKGFFWAWLIHFLPDAFIFTFYAMSA